MTTNTAPTNGTQLQGSSDGSLIYTNSSTTNSSCSNCSYHKSFDFSNINIGSSYYKQFHQTRIYVKDFAGMTTNGNDVGGTSSTYIISSNLPDSFNYAIGSEWGSPLSDIFKGVGNLVMQFGSGGAVNAGGDWEKVGRHFRSGINRAANFLIWNGAKPLEIQLKIPVLDDDCYQSGCSDTKTNLKEALEFLGCLALPKLEGRFGFYTPAPSPLDLKITAGFEKDGNGETTTVDKTYNLTPNKARIMVQIGGMLFIDNCIIKNVSVSYPNTKALIIRDNILTPILAEVTITISTIETLTSTTYTKMLWRKEQADQGTFHLNLNEAWETAKGVGKEVVGTVINNVDGMQSGEAINSTGKSGSTQAASTVTAIPGLVQNPSNPQIINPVIRQF